MGSSNFRDFIHPPDHPRSLRFAGKNARQHGEAVVAGNPELFRVREELFSQPFVGVTSDGKIVKDLFALANEGAPTADMVDASWNLLDRLSPEQKKQGMYDIEATEWRRWHNAEYYNHNVGLRLEELSDELRDGVMEVIRATLSPTGYAMVRDLMIFNEFLGELVHAPLILGEWSYNFSFFGTPSNTDPWGWAIFGHHLVINCFVLEGQLVMTPTFYGAEPNYIDEGPYAGKRLFQREEQLGLDLINALSHSLRDEAVLFDAIRDPSMPPGRVHKGDQLHLAGAFRDNRVIPYEGAGVAQFSALQRRRVMEVMASFHKEMPAGPLYSRLQLIERHLDESHFCWIGKTDGSEPFYFRIQSPVVLIEFDQHAGVFLANEQPERFHVHTIVRTPNGNDYGKDLLRLHYEQKHN